MLQERTVLLLSRLMAVALFPKIQLLTDQSREIGLAKEIRMDVSRFTAISDGLSMR
jgi:hypothetical protein